jgi:hypothetical protein
MNSGTDQQIKTAYEVNGMTPEQISDDLGFTIESIKAKLMQISSSYRKDCGLENPTSSTLNFSDEQLARVNDEIYQLALGSDDEHLKFKALTYIRDDKKGRKDVVRQMAGTTFNMFQFNQMLQAGRSGAQRIKESLVTNSTKIIEA